ncbi:MAG TPA: YceD family protein [Bacillota bacterium]|nr:YceD family protein [Bacillota bacterium]
MKFALSHIRKNAFEKPFNFSGEVDVSDVASLNNDIRQATTANVSGSCVIEGDEYVFTLMISGQLILPCARTLVDVNYEYSIEAIEVFSESPHYGREEEENDIHPIESELIDLSPLIKENIILNLPYRVYSTNKEDFEAAVTDGEGWVLTTEDELEKQEVAQESTQIDPRLKKLQALLDDEEEK